MADLFTGSFVRYMICFSEGLRKKRGESTGHEIAVKKLSPTKTGKQAGDRINTGFLDKSVIILICRLRYKEACKGITIYTILTWFYTDLFKLTVLNFH